MQTDSFSILPPTFIDRFAKDIMHAINMGKRELNLISGTRSLKYASDGVIIEIRSTFGNNGHFNHSLVWEEKVPRRIGVLYCMHVSVPMNT